MSLILSVGLTGGLTVAVGGAVGLTDGLTVAVALVVAVALGGGVVALGGAVGSGSAVMLGAVVALAIAVAGAAVGVAVIGAVGVATVVAVALAVDVTVVVAGAAPAVPAPRGAACPWLACAWPGVSPASSTLQSTTTQTSPVFCTRSTIARVSLSTWFLDVSGTHYTTRAARKDVRKRTLRQFALPVPFTHPLLRPGLGTDGCARSTSATTQTTTATWWR